MAIGFILGQEYLKYQFKTEISKGIENVGGLLGIKKEIQKGGSKNTVSKNEPEKKPVLKEVPFDPERMSNEGYLNTKWGMTRQEVIDLTGAANDESGKYLHMKSEIAGEEADVVYYFVNDRLFKTAILVYKETSNQDNYIPIYSRIGSLLTEKYGKPKKTTKRGSSNPYISDGLAIATGQGFYATEWETPESDIGILLRGDNYKIKLIVYYESKKYMPIAEKYRKEKAKDKL